MRNKIAKRIKKWCVSNGVNILKDEYGISKEEAKEDKGRRGWVVQGEYNGLKYYCIGEDRLECYQMLRDCIKDDNALRENSEKN